ncbi:MAG: phosphatidate cytidylyltransferase [Alphaproteobacteria bacterium]|nr:phosphatidate cytidylyltransferase [Alphaproteobacteria bacterium]
MPVPSFLKKFDTVNLRLRVISAAILIPVTLICVWLGGIAFGAFVTCVVTLGLYEWLRLVGQKFSARNMGIACAMLAALMTGGWLISPPFGAMLGVVATLALFLLASGEDRAGWIALGIPYLGGSGLALIALRDIPDIGAALVLFLLVTVWGTDIGAFVAGKIWGRAKLAPSISPSKTWAGLAGGMILAALCGYIAAVVLGARRPDIALMLSPVLAVIAQVGDLFESHFKRRAGVKESGDLIPGHGGVLDRVDGLIFAGVFLILFQISVAQQIDWW